jgi:hypothetical protein
LEAQATVARGHLHTAIRDAKRNHWESFLEDQTNIWKAARYLNPGSSGFANIAVLQSDRRKMETNREKAQTF